MQQGRDALDEEQAADKKRMTILTGGFAGIALACIILLGVFGNKGSAEQSRTAGAKSIPGQRHMLERRRGRIADAAVAASITRTGGIAP